MPDLRIMFVHAHPDDESIETGATMARYAAEGAHVCLVTCTRGEEGEVVPEDLRGLSGDRLGEYRTGELDRACAALGVEDHRFLGGAGRWRDSGMMGAPSNNDPRCFWRADVGEAAAELLRIMREVRPQVVVTYDDNGFYGHPDHIQAHRVAWRAFQRAPDASVGEGRPWRPSRFYATAVPLPVLERAVLDMAVLDMAAADQAVSDQAADQVSDQAGRGAFDRVRSAREFGFGVPAGQVTTGVDGTAHLPAKLAALRAHATQLTVRPPYLALSNNVAQPILATEYYTRLSGEPGIVGEDGRETGLFETVA